ncbi:MAG TPA: PASTA domain-containing protein [Micromonosporaceae bacterium]
MAEGERPDEPAPVPSAPAEPGDASPEAEPPDLAETAEHAGLAETAPQPGLAETAEHPLAETAGHPELAETAPPTVWSARARVPPPDHDLMAPAEWEELPPERGPLVPVLITVCVIMLLGLIGLGIWLLTRASNEAPRPLPTVPVTTATRSATPAPATTEATVTASASTTTLPVVALPDLRGEDYETAASALVELGLVPIRVDQSDLELSAGQVIGTNPPAGSFAAPGLRVRVFVSTGSPSLEPTSAEPTGSPTD